MLVASFPRSLLLRVTRHILINTKIKFAPLNSPSSDVLPLVLMKCHGVAPSLKVLYVSAGGDNLGNHPCECCCRRPQKPLAAAPDGVSSLRAVTQQTDCDSSTFYFQLLLARSHLHRGHISSLSPPVPPLTKHQISNAACKKTHNFPPTENSQTLTNETSRERRLTAFGQPC